VGAEVVARTVLNDLGVRVATAHGKEVADYLPVQFKRESAGGRHSRLRRGGDIGHADLSAVGQGERKWSRGCRDGRDAGSLQE
jgi:hypothetical protein